VLAGHHTNAAESRERGSAKLRARAHAMFRMEGVEDGQVGLVCEKQRGGPKVAAEMAMAPVATSVCLTAVWEGSALAYGARRHQAQEAAKRARRQADSALKDALARELLTGALLEGSRIPRDKLLNACLGNDVGKKKLGEELDAMVEEEVVVEEAGPRKARLYTLRS
jgi:hypothetical protein